MTAGDSKAATTITQPALVSSPQSRPAPTRRALPSKPVAQRGQNWTPIRGQICKPIDSLIGISATPEPRNAIMLPWLGEFQVCVCAAQAALCPGLLHCSHETNSISATTAKALVVEVPGVDHRMMSPIGRLC